MSEDDGTDTAMAAYRGSQPDGQPSAIHQPLQSETPINLKDSNFSSGVISEDDGADALMAAYLGS